MNLLIQGSQLALARRRLGRRWRGNGKIVVAKSVDCGVKLSRKRKDASSDDPYLAHQSVAAASLEEEDLDWRRGRQFSWLVWSVA